MNWIVCGGRVTVTPDRSPILSLHFVSKGPSWLWHAPGLTILHFLDFCSPNQPVATSSRPREPGTVTIFGHGRAEVRILQKTIRRFAAQLRRPEFTDRHCLGTGTVTGKRTISDASG